jgi:hypothetical protein
VLHCTNTYICAFPFTCVARYFDGIRQSRTRTGAVTYPRHERMNVVCSSELAHDGQERDAQRLGGVGSASPQAGWLCHFLSSAKSVRSISLQWTRFKRPPSVCVWTPPCARHRFGDQAFGSTRGVPAQHRRLGEPLQIITFDKAMTPFYESAFEASGHSAIVDSWT